jgi:segregation and condensation protein B
LIPNDRTPPDDDELDEEGCEEYSLEDLGAAYARAMAESEPNFVPQPTTEPQTTVEVESEPIVASLGDDDDASAINPMSIVEAALFVGHPDNRPLTAAQIAGTMRGVSAEEVEQIIVELNQIYRRDGHPFTITARDAGYAFGLNDSMRSVRSMFYGKVRETRLNQASIDVLALVAYQPGVNAATIADQRGKDSSAILNQLVRRELLEVRREAKNGGKPVPCYYPTERLLNLLGLTSLEDLPQVDEADIAPRT